MSNDNSGSHPGRKGDAKSQLPSVTLQTGSTIRTEPGTDLTDSTNTDDTPDSHATLTAANAFIATSLITAILLIITELQYPQLSLIPPLATLTTYIVTSHNSLTTLKTLRP